MPKHSTPTLPRHLSRQVIFFARGRLSSYHQRRHSLPLIFFESNPEASAASLLLPLHVILRTEIHLYRRRLVALYKYFVGTSLMLEGELQDSRRRVDALTPLRKDPKLTPKDNLRLTVQNTNHFPAYHRTPSASFKAPESLPVVLPTGRGRPHARTGMSRDGLE